MDALSQSQDSSYVENHRRPKHDEQKELKEFTLDLFIERASCDFPRTRWLELFDLTKNEKSVRDIYLNDTKLIPEVEGTAFSIEDASTTRKCEALYFILKELEKGLNTKQLNIILLIPEGVVSYLIGSHGRQINSIMKETGAEIVVNQPINKFPPRTVRMSGPSQKLNSAITVITQKIAERGVTEEDYKITEPLDPSKIHTKVKLLLQEEACDFLHRHKEELQAIEEKNKVKIKIIESKKIKHQKRDEMILTLEGKLSPIQQGVITLLRKLEPFYNRQRDSDVFVKIVMPSSYASKLIGASKRQSLIDNLEGCMIRELANKSKGAQIKVLSEKTAEVDSECIVQVGGTLANRQEATILILEQIECFRNGGPVNNTIQQHQQQDS